jgi:hypothetical protein
MMKMKKRKPQTRKSRAPARRVFLHGAQIADDGIEDVSADGDPGELLSIGGGQFVVIAPKPKA